jgi:hypothetical protein
MPQALSPAASQRKAGPEVVDAFHPLERNR